MQNTPDLTSLANQVLQLRKNQSVIGKDIQEVFNTAKAVGFDRSVFSRFISEVQRRNKAIDANQLDLFNEKQALLGSYLTEFYSKSAA